MKTYSDYNLCKECNNDDTITSITPIYSEVLLINSFCTTCEIDNIYKVEYSELHPNGIIVS